MKDKSIKIVVCPATGARLCQDGRWRKFANFGTYSSCVREFRYLKSAQKAARRNRHPLNKTTCDTFVTHLHPGDSMDASGHVTRAINRDEAVTEWTMNLCHN